MGCKIVERRIEEMSIQKRVVEENRREKRKRREREEKEKSIE